jgi:hypothetical protein
MAPRPVTANHTLASKKHGPGREARGQPESDAQPKSCAINPVPLEKGFGL